MLLNCNMDVQFKEENSYKFRFHLSPNVQKHSQLSSNQCSSHAKDILFFFLEPNLNGWWYHAVAIA